MAELKRLKNLYAFFPTPVSFGFVIVNAVERCPKTPDNSV